MNKKTSPSADFGFRKVRTEEKAGLVRGVFDSVAPHYDVMNDLMSGGVHRLWKSVLLDRLGPQPGEVLLDVAGGTGDIALGFLSRAGRRPGAANKSAAKAVICDINYEMLNAGFARDERAGVRDDVTRICGDAQSLPIESGSIDSYTIVFGIRNVTDMDAALCEAYRVLRPGGRFLCLEFSHPITESLQKIYDEYSFNVIPWLGEHVADDRESYQYLVESIRKFPLQDVFADRIKSAGFSRVSYENLTGGVAALHAGWRI